MRHLTQIVFLAFAAMLCMSCESPRVSRPRADSSETIERVRTRVLDQMPTLDGDSREMIRTNAPKITFRGVPFGGVYYFQWAVSSNRMVSLDTLHSLDHIESEAVQVWQRRSDSRY